MHLLQTTMKRTQSEKPETEREIEKKLLNIVKKTMFNREQLQIIKKNKSFHVNFYDQLKVLCFLFADGNEMGISGLTNLLNRLKYEVMFVEFSSTASLQSLLFHSFGH